ncbi:MAG: hypothetical protein ACTTGJ_01765 [Clostridium sp.]
MTKKVNQYENILDKIIIKLGIELEDRQNALDIIEIIKQKKLTISLISNYPQVLNIKSSKVKNVIEQFKESELPISLLEKNPEIFERTNRVRIQKISALVKNKDITLQILEKFPEVIGVGKDENILKILKIFKEKGLGLEYFKNNGDILAYGDATEISKIFKVLEEYEIEKVILKKCPKVFYLNTANVVKELLLLYTNPKEKLGLQIIKKNPQILAYTTKIRVQAILNMFDRNGIEKNILQKSPEIVYENETKDIENIIAILKQLNISKEEISKNSEVLMYDTIELSKLIKKIRYLEEFEDIFKNVLEDNFKLVISIDLNTIIEYIEAVEKEKIDKEYIYKYPQYVLKNTPNNVINVIDIFEKIEDSNYIERNPQILTIQEPNNILKIQTVFVKYGLNKEILENVNVYLNGNAKNIEEIVQEIDDRGLSRNILNNAFILIKGNPENITQILDKLEKEEQQDNGIGKEILEKSSTILTTGNVESIDEVKEFLKSKNLLDNPEVEIPGIIFAKGKADNMEQIYTFLESVGLINELKNSLSLFIKPVSNIQTNLDLLIEYDMLDSVIQNISVLGLSPETLEKRLKFLKYNNEEITVQILKLTQDKFFEKYNTNESDMSKVPKEYLAQVIISSEYSKYLEKEYGIFDDETKEIYNNILEEILEYGIVKKELIYIKADYNYSLIKIKENLKKILYNTSLEKDLQTLDKKDYIYIQVLSILGNKKVSEEEAEKVCRSVIRQEKEIEVNEKYKHKIIIETEEIEPKEKIEEKNQELQNEVVEPKYEYKDEEYKKDLEELGLSDDNIDEEVSEADNKNDSDNLNNIYGLSIENVDNIENPENTKIKDINEDNIEIKEEALEIEETEETEEVEQEKIKVLVEELKEKQIQEEKKINKINKFNNILDNVKEQEEQNFEFDLDNLSNSLKEYTETIHRRKIDEELRKKREEEEKLSKIRQRRQEKELEELRRKNAELEKLRIAKEEELRIKIANEEAKRLEEEEKLRQKLEEERLKQKEQEELLRQKLEAEARKKQEEQEAINLKIKAEAERIAQIEIDKIRQEQEIAKRIEQEAKKIALQKENELKRQLLQEMQIRQEQEEKYRKKLEEEEDDLEKYYRQKSVPNINLEEISTNMQQNIDNLQNSNSVQQLISNMSEQYQNYPKQNNIKPQLQPQNYTQTEEFSRTIDAYYNQERKPFFNLDDYGYILNTVNSEEQQKMQIEMNQLYKMKKNNFYDE